jgi:hypothetical protein
MKNSVVRTTAINKSDSNKWFNHKFNMKASQFKTKIKHIRENMNLTWNHENKEQKQNPSLPKCSYNPNFS